ncbi:hypothetical protein FA10DRAFT_264623 [Acaromyces ingoldii]|uniref:Mediator of RNA polymerase II transcription subunit 11 n=1 Tax=Acaromyces ingoldii TaxID=215250 RepID=A0A316YWX1_9BASI|nr:hypothetical protein FA10DRAFT_264623 [Acaromyces ingoldii]PWN94030.1 hypothetical protein FA10DRAFT_264623 [Acaromyces ingoldii]
MTASSSNPASQPAIAPQLEEKIEAVRSEKLLADAERRRIAVRAKNEKARRMVRRLESCDGNIADLLSQASDCLRTLVDATAHESAYAAHADVRSYNESEDELRKTFELRAQQWFATLHEVQLGLRSAVRNLRKAQMEPTQRDISAAAGGPASSSSSSSSVPASPALNHVGKAERGHGLGIHTTEASLSESSSSSRSSLLDAFVDVGLKGPDLIAEDKKATKSSLLHDTKLSLSALRMQEHSWQQLAEALGEIAERRQAGSRSSKGSQRATSLPKMSQGQKERVRSLANDLVAAKDSQDSRLMSALLQMGIGPTDDVGTMADSMRADSGRA